MPAALRAARDPLLLRPARPAPPAGRRGPASGCRPAPAHQRIVQQRPHHQVGPVGGRGRGGGPPASARRPRRAGSGRRGCGTALPRGAGIAEGQRDLALAAAQHRQRLRRLGLHQRHPHPRMGAPQPGDSVRHQSGTRGREGHQPHPPGPQPGDRRHLLLGGRQARQDPGRVLEQHLARLAQLHPAAGPDHQRAADRLLQRLHLLADRRLGAAQLPGGGGEGAGPRDGAQDPEMASLDHALSISDTWRYFAVIGNGL